MKCSTLQKKEVIDPLIINALKLPLKREVLPHSFIEYTHSFIQKIFISATLPQTLF